MLIFSKLIAFMLIILYAGLAHAYIGPGLGAGAIAAVLGVIGSVFVGIFAIIYYPLKRKRRKKKQESEKNSPANTDQENTDNDKDGNDQQ